jgi:PQQ-dependent dehydrogenase (s-GDH family)
MNNFTRFFIILLSTFCWQTNNAQQIDVLGNGQSIGDNSSNSPQINNYTDFQSSATRTFTIDNSQNSGNTTLNVSSISLSNSSDFSITSDPTPIGIAKGGPNPTFEITFNALSIGSFTSTVTVFSDATNDGGDGWEFTISADNLPEIEIADEGDTTVNNSGSFDFGTIPPNSSSSKDFSIKNLGPAATTLMLSGSPIVNISGDSEFSVAAQPSSNTITGGNSETFTVLYNPTVIGSHSATISIANDDNDENPYTFTVDGMADNITYTPTTSGPDWNVSSISSGINEAFEMIYGPDDYLWITEKDGYIVRVDPVNGGAKSYMLDITSLVTHDHSQNGLLGMAIHPDLYADVTTTTNNYVYLAYSYSSGGLKVRIARYTYNYNGGNGFLDSGSAYTVLEDFEGSNTGHSGGRLIIGPPNVPVADQKLYYSIGDQEKNRGGNACNEIRSQYLPTSSSDYSDYEGKILRMNLDGTIPSDNPTLNLVQSHVYTYGHRNPQGLVFGSDGKLYSSEHGDKTDDEINVILSGQNYGWPLISGYNDDLGYAYCNWSAYPANCGSYNANSCPGPYTDESTSYPSISTNFQEPVGTYNSTVTLEPTGGYLSWPTVAPSSIDIYEAGLIPDWDKSLFIPTLKGNKIFRSKLNLSGDALESQVYEEFHSASGTRYRDIAFNLDGGTMYCVTDAGNIERLEFIGTTLTNSDFKKEEFAFSLVPNPTSNSFKIITKQHDSQYISRIQLVDIQGRLVKEISDFNVNNTIRVNNLTNGMYFVQLFNDKNQNIAIKKLIIKH